MNIERVNQLLLDIAESRHIRECKLTLTDCHVCFGILDRKKHDLQPFVIAIEFIEELCNHVIESSASVAIADKVRSSAESFVAALVDERFKKDHAAMLDELHELRIKDIEASKRLRIEINAMPESVRTIFESARIEAKSKGVPIVRALVDMVAKTRTMNSNQRDRIAHDDNRIRELGTERNGLKGSLFALREELRIARDGYESRLSQQAQLITELRDECRTHLARINVLESNTLTAQSSAALQHSNQLLRRNLSGQYSVSFPMILHCPSCGMRHIDERGWGSEPHHTHACQSCGTVWRPAIVATLGVQFLPGFKDATTMPVNESTGQDVAKVESSNENATIGNVVPDDVLQRASSWANKKSKLMGLPSDTNEARNAVNNISAVAPTWQNDVREFVKLWREGQAPDTSNGQRLKPCVACNGIGQVECNHGEHEPCQTCNGTGKLTATIDK